MKTLQSISELRQVPGPVHLAIGVFDGVHLGHTAVIDHAVASARVSGGTAVVVTFDPHPASVLRPEQTPLLLTSTRHKLRLLADLGVSHVLVLPFTNIMASTAPADFIVSLSEACKPLRQICVGEDWAFGSGRAGNLQLLQLLGHAMRYEAVGIRNVVMEGEVVSSTSIRSAVQRGDLAAATKLLGRTFSVLGTVVEGKHLGRTIGFPTANIRPECEQLPPNGVYVVEAIIGRDHYGGVANIGLRPTVEAGATEPLLEVHVLEFDGDLVGTDMEVLFHVYVRAERKFPSTDALREQIALDVNRARKIFGLT